MRRISGTAVLLGALTYTLVEQVGLSRWLERVAEALSIPVAVPRTLIATVGVVGFTAFFARVALVVERRPLRGRWVLTSDSGEYGLATFPIGPRGIAYVADLYATEEDVAAALGARSGATTRCFARLRSASVERGEDGFTILYEIRRVTPGYPERKGILELSEAAGTTELRGFWNSTAEGDGDRGAVTFMRPEAFLEGRAG